MSDAGEFQEVESNHSGRLSYFPSQPAMIPSSRSMLSRDKILPLDTWNMSGPQEHLFIILRHQVLQDQFRCILVQGLLSQEMKIGLEAQFQCRHLQEGRPIFPVEFHRIPKLDSKDFQYRRFILVNSPHFQRFHVGR